MSNITTLTFESTTFDIVDQHGQPWMRMRDIIQALYEGDDQSVTPFENAERAVKRVFEKNRDEFTDAMTAVIPLQTAGGVQDVRVFSFRGAHLLGMLAKSKKAKAFRVWLLDLIEREGSQAQAIPALPSTITPAQRQELHELVQLIVESGKQTWGETWKRFHNKFRVAKYEQLPSARFEEAKQYLKGKLDAESTIDLIGKHLNDRMPAAMELALAAASGVFTEALKHALTHEDPPSLIRLMASANYVPGQGMKAGVTPIGRDKCVMSFDDMTNAVNEPGGLRLSNTQLLGMLGAVTNKLTSRDTDQHRLAA